MPACFGLSSCLSRLQQPTEYKETYISFKQESLGDYSVYCSSQNGIRPANRGEAKVRMTATELISARSLLKDLEITKNPHQDSKVKSTNCGMPYFPLK